MKIYLLSEQEQAWTDSLGTQQPARNFTTGRASLGSKFLHSFEVWDDDRLEPYFGLYGDYVFMSDDAVTIGVPITAIQSGWAGRLTGGLRFSTATGSSITIGGEYGGLGANYSVFTGMVRGRVAF